MKQFLKGITIFLLPVLIICFCSEILLRKIPNDYLYKRNYLDTNSKKIKILFLGSSHVYYGINPAYIKANSFNAAYTSQSLDYDFEILKKYDNKWDSLKYIVVPVDYFSLYSKLETSDEAWRVKNYTIYYGMHTTNKIENYSEILGNKFNINATRLYSFYFKNNSNITCSKLGWGNGYGYNSKDKNDLITSGKEAAIRHLAKSDHYFSENVEILKSIIEFAKAKNIKVILFTSPAYKTYVQNLDKTQLNYTINEVTKLANAKYNVV